MMKPMAKKPVRSFEGFAVVGPGSPLGGLTSIGVPADSEAMGARGDDSGRAGAALDRPVSCPVAVKEKFNSSVTQASVHPTLFLIFIKVRIPRQFSTSIPRFQS